MLHLRPGSQLGRRGPASECPAARSPAAAVAAGAVSRTMPNPVNRPPSTPPNTIVARSGLTGLVPVLGASTRAIRLAALALALSDRALVRFCSARSSNFARLVASLSRLA